MSSPNPSRPVTVIIVGSVMFTFISYWRTAAVVLCDLASTAYYIGGIVEQAIGPAAPWYILGVMLFSYAVRAVYIESCSLFVRGGVYRVVREALGGFFAKLAVSALMFDYLLTGPISSVSAGQYLIGLFLDTAGIVSPSLLADIGLADPANRDFIKRWGSVVIACLITVYFYRQNLIGLHESSDKAIKIMLATTVMAVIVLIWCAATLIARGPANSIPWQPDLSTKVVYDTEVAPDRVTGELKEMWKLDADGKPIPKLDDEGKPIPKVNPITNEPEDPLGFMGRVFPPDFVQLLRNPPTWLSLIGLLGLFVAFGHSILAMSGEETLAQVYREVESPKLQNFQKAAFIVFVYSLVVTAGISILAVLLIPNEVRMKDYSDNLISGLAMYVIGPPLARLLLSALVVIVGSFILAGAVNTAIIGSNGVFNRVAEDGVVPEWFLKPHPHYGTTYRVLRLIVGLQLFIIILSQGNTLLLGEAYAFGVVWSFVFQALSMVVLRFTDPRPREFKVPLNFKVGSVEIPVGLLLVMGVLLVTAALNFLTKEVATVSGLVFTGMFFTIFFISEQIHHYRRKGEKHEHLEQFNKQTADELSSDSLQLSKPYRKLVAIRSTQNLFMLEKTLAETDPETTGVVVMTAKVASVGDSHVDNIELDRYDQQLMTAVVQKAEKAGKEVKPLILPTNNPLYAIVKTAKDIGAQELVLGASNKYTADELLEQLAFYWISLHSGEPAPLTVRILGRDRDVHLDMAGGNRIPKISERQARSAAELRAAGVGIDRALFVHDGSPASGDLFEALLTLIDPGVHLIVLPIVPIGNEPHNGHGIIHQDEERAKRIGRELVILKLEGSPAEEIIRHARETKSDLIILPLPSDVPVGRTGPLDQRTLDVLDNAPCRVFLAAPPPLPKELEEQPLAPAT